MAALLTRMPIPPYSAARPATSTRVASRSARSPGTKRAAPGPASFSISAATRSPGLPGRSSTSTRAPWLASAAAVAEPSPPAAPVTSATCPAIGIGFPFYLPVPLPQVRRLAILPRTADQPVPLKPLQVAKQRLGQELVRVGGPLAKQRA